MTFFYGVLMGVGTTVAVYLSIKGITRGFSKITLF